MYIGIYIFINLVLPPQADLVFVESRVASALTTFDRSLVKDVIGLEKSFEKEVGKDIQQVRHTHTHI